MNFIPSDYEYSPSSIIKDNDKVVDNMKALAAAIALGKSYHLFHAKDGGYLASYYFPQTAQNAAASLEFPVVVKYLTNQKIGA